MPIKLIWSVGVIPSSSWSGLDAKGFNSLKNLTPTLECSVHLVSFNYTMIRSKLGTVFFYIFLNLWSFILLHMKQGKISNILFLICRRHLGVELLKSGRDGNESFLKTLWHHSDAIVCCSLKVCAWSPISIAILIIFENLSEFSYFLFFLWTQLMHFECPLFRTRTSSYDSYWIPWHVEGVNS